MRATGRSGPSVCHLSEMQLGMSLDEHRTVQETYLGCSGRSSFPRPCSPLALATFLQSLHLPHLYILSLSVQNPPPRIHQSNVLVLGTSTCPSVTWCSWGAELRCVLLGMNWPHGVRGLFLDVNQQRGEFYDWN